MSTVAHFAIFITYALAAIVAAVILPGIFPILARDTAMLLGLIVLLAGALGHEAITRRQAEIRAIHRLVVLRKAYDQNREDVERARDELRRVYEMIEARDNEPTPGGEIQEVASEVKVLHGLVEQLYTEGGGPDFTANAGAGSGPGLAAAPRGDDTAPALPAGLGQTAILDIVRDALRQNRIDLYVQPIVSLPQRKNRYFECFSGIRAADGAVVTADRYIAVAKDAGLIKAIDNMLLFRCVQLIRKIQKHDYRTAFFCNVSPNSHADREFFKEFMSFLESCEDLAPSIVFEFSQADLATRTNDAIEDVRRLGRVGYRFCMDQVTDIDFDAAAFAGQGFQFVKIEADTLLANSGDNGARRDLPMLKNDLDRVGVDLIVEKIESEQTLLHLLDHNIDFGQGYLFGEPRISKDPPLNPLRLADDE
jgi:cyclic-di-GMP phosphodiesterase TipF (flagellum assembly factor)